MNTLWNEKLTVKFANIILGFMMFFAGITFVYLWRMLSPNWSGSYLPVLFFVITLEALYSQRKISSFSLMNPGWFVYRFSEVVLIILFVRITIFLQHGLNYTTVFIERIWPNIWEVFFDPEFQAAFILVLAVWGITTWIGKLLVDLESDEIIYNSDFNESFHTDRGQINRQLASAIFLIGTVLVIFVALMNAEIEMLWGSSTPNRPGGWNILFYFVLGFLLLSQGQLSALRAGWGWQRISIPQELTRNWIVASVIFLAIITLLISFLPTEYSVGFLATFRYMFSLISTFILGLLLLVLYIPIYLLSLLLGFLFGNSVDIPFNPPLFFSQNFIQREMPADRSPIIFGELLKSFVFWIVFIVIIGYAFIQYVQQNQALMAKLRALPGWGWATSGFKRLFRWLLGFKDQVAAQVNLGTKRLFSRFNRTDIGKTLMYFRVNQLSPRERIRFFYLSFVRRGGESGLQRLSSQTPLEYAKYLEKNLASDLKSDIDSLTEAFVAAQYSRGEIDEGKAYNAKQVWIKLKKALRERIRG